MLTIACYFNFLEKEFIPKVSTDWGNSSDGLMNPVMKIKKTFKTMKNFVTCKHVIKSKKYVLRMTEFDYNNVLKLPINDKIK